MIVYGWYLRNALSASADDRLTRLVRRYIIHTYAALNAPEGLLVIADGGPAGSAR